MNIKMQDSGYVVKELVIPVLDGSLTIACQLFVPKGVYDIQGYDARKRILTMAGWSDNSGSFIALSQLLVNKGYIMLNMDCIGTGLSSHRPPSSLYNDFEEAAHIISVADHVGWDRFNMVAHSRGAGISALAVGAFSERFLSFIAFDNVFGFAGIYPMDHVGQPVSKVQRYRKAYKQFERNLIREKKTYDSVDEAIKALVRDKDWPKSKTTATNIVLREITLHKGKYMLKHDKRIYGVQQFISIDDSTLQEFLSEIKCPTMLIVVKDSANDDAGKNSIESYNVLIKQRLSCIRDLEYKKVLGGHHVHSDNPDLACKLILDFYSRKGLLSESRI